MSDQPSEHDSDSTETDPAPGPADHGGHGGMATRENDTADEPDSADD